MPVVFKCECGKYLSVRSKNIGKKIRCPICRAINVVPDPTEKHSKRLQRLDTKRLEASGFQRLKDAVDDDEDVALQDEEVAGLDLKSASGEEAPAVQLEKDMKLKDIDDSEPDEHRHDKRKKEKVPGKEKDRDKEKPRDAGEKHRDKEKLGASGEKQRHGEKHHEKHHEKDKDREKHGKDKKKGGIEIMCFCGTKADTGGKKPGETFVCSSCGRTITIPAAAKSAPSIDLAPEEDGDHCPSCGVLLDAPSRRCDSCGGKIDLRLLQSPEAKRMLAEEAAAKKAKKGWLG